MRQPLVIANWKMHGERSSNRALVSQVEKSTASVLAKTGGDALATCVVCPPYPYIAETVALLGDSAIAVGAQDCSHADAGAYTGEVAAAMLADIGCRWVIVGHSERRQYHRESDALVAAKVAAARRAGLTAVLCVGETQEQREAGVAEDVVREQLEGALSDARSLEDVVIAYEPVWAIGTGLTATPEEAQAMHAHLRELMDTIDGSSAPKTHILYGGSVKATNADALFEQRDIDGALVGGASLDPEAFSAIVLASVRA